MQLHSNAGRFSLSSCKGIHQHDQNQQQQLQVRESTPCVALAVAKLAGLPEVGRLGSFANWAAPT